jgi:hypothetical protein
MVHVLRDHEITEAWVADKVERRAAHATLKAVVGMIESVVGGGLLERCVLPDGVNIMKLKKHEERVTRDGAYHILDTNTKQTQPVLPVDFQVKGLPVVNHTIDRCGIGAAAMHFAMSAKLVLWAVHWGPLHDQWNAIKTACKLASGGAVWAAITKFSGVCNLPFGPFRSSAWKTFMQNALNSLSQRLGQHSVEFIAAVERQMVLQPDRFQGDSDPFSCWWEFFCRLPTCCDNPTAALKFARWFSIGECWEALRDEWFLLGLVFRDMCSNIELDGTGAGESTLLWDGSLQEFDDVQKGLLNKVPRYITEEVAVLMDVFAACTEPYAHLYKERTGEVKSPEQHLEHADLRARGAWMLPVIGSAEKIADVTAMDKLFRIGGVEASKLTDIIFDFSVHLIAEHALREMPRVLDYPATCVKFSNKKEPHADLLTLMASDWKAVLKAEELSHTDAKMAAFLQDIHWLTHPLPRLLLALADEQVTFNTRNGECQLLAEACTYKFGDEKVPEDLHASIRDTERQARKNKVSLARIHHICQVSGVLEGRGVTTPHVELAEVATASWYGSGALPATHQARQTPEVWPDQFDHILRPRRDWPSPNDQNALSSILSFAVLVDWWNGVFSAEEEPWMCWWSRLTQRGQLVKAPATGEYFLVLCPGQFGTLAHIVKQHDDGLLSLSNDEQGDPMFVLCIPMPYEFEVWAFTPVRDEAKGICMMLDSGAEARSLLSAALSARRAWTKWELDSAFRVVEPDANLTGTIAKMRSRLIKLVFADKPELIAFHEELYKKDKAPAEAPVDAEMLSLLTELAFDDFANASDLRAFSSDLNTAAIRTLQKRRRVHRADLVYVFI